MENQQLEGEFNLPTDGTTEAPANKSATTNKNPVHFWTSFVENPADVVYSEQDPGEEILAIIRRDFITNVPWIVGAIILIIVPIFILPVLSSLFPFLSLTSSTQTLLVAAYYLIVFGFILLNFTLWYFHVGLLTSKRVVDVDLYGILIRDVSETKLNLVKDVNYHQIGALQSLFNYGDVSVQTEGPLVDIEFDRVPEPARIEHIIGNLIGGDSD